MSDICSSLHQRIQALSRYCFPFQTEDILQDGIYFLFEKGESGHNGDRIVRIGTHTGAHKLATRITEHFINENKDRSIFRKNIGRCLLKKTNDRYLEVWEIDFTSSASANNNRLRDVSYEQSIEQQVTAYMQRSFSFAVVPVVKKEVRMALESKLIATVAKCDVCSASDKWLGSISPKPKIAESGLWQVQHLRSVHLNERELEQLFHNG